MAAVGYLEGKRVIDFTRAFAMYNIANDYAPDPAGYSIIEMLEAEMFAVDLLADVRAFVEEHRLTDLLAVPNATLLAPIPNPPRIIALGLNYAAHAAEGGRKPPKEPIFFVKASTAVIGPDEPVVCPQNVGRIDHEVELAVIIGKGGRRISRAKAMEHVAGYTILNDVTARDLQRRDMAASNPWFMSKSFDTFAPMGPCIVLPDEIPDPHDLDLTLRVNGKVKQKSNTSQLIFKIPDLIYHLSKRITLQPGDVISTGTPEGISAIEPGDVMEAEVERIGVLRNPVAAE
jgi:2-keto-4-pentenoate hydratase/2-oxohepta-3-ene-1,7-dioic acid hydratase in catechol pathway